MTETRRIETVFFRGPAGRLEGLWIDAAPPRRGSAVFAHPHPLGGGTLHNKVVYRAAKALVASGWATLRFNFRGVGRSEGEHDAGRGEVGDVRAAFDEAVKRGGTPLVAGGFSFGSAAALRAALADPRAVAFVGIGFPLATAGVEAIERPSVPALFVTGERDEYGPPELLRAWAGDSAEVVVVPGSDHFFTGHLDEVESALGAFLRSLAVEAAR